MAEQAVQRLKELLFDKETRELGDLSRRLDVVFERAGTENRFRSSVAEVIDGALRDAEIARHRELAEAIAPLVVRTVRTEIHASQDLLVEALYPKTGELVRKYVASAMRDLVDDLNRRLESSLPINRWLLKAKSVFTGRSMAELAIAEAHPFAVEDLYLVRRGSGELVEHWARPGGAPASEADDAVFGSVLAAITGFTDQALAGQEGSLRTLEIGDRVLYVRASPAHLLAARCRTTAPPSIEQALDEELLHALESHRAVETERRPGARAPVGGAPRPLLAPLAGRIEEAVRAKQAGLVSPGPSPVKVLAWLVVPLLLALIGWQGWIGLNTWSTRRSAEATLARIEGLRDYPVKLEVARGGGSILVSGLSPTGAEKAQLMAGLRHAVPGVDLVDRLATLPEAVVATDFSPQIDAVKGDVGALRRDVGALEGRLQQAGVLDRVKQVERRLAAMARSLERLAEAPDAAKGGGFASEARDLVKAALAEVSALGSGAAGEARLLAALNGAITRLRGAVARAGGTGTDGTVLPRSAAEAAAELNRLAELMSALVGRAEALAAQGPLEQRLTALGSELDRLKSRPQAGPDGRERLERAAREYAVFFANGSEFRDEAAAARAIGAIAAAMAGFDGLVRVVGYTDERGNATGNLPIAQARAQKVADLLVARGVPRGRLVVLGRVAGGEISAETGAQSPNRRVVFEAGFRGEAP